MLLWTSLLNAGGFSAGGGGPVPGDALVYAYGEPNAGGTCGATRNFRSDITIAQGYVCPFNGTITGVQVYLNQTTAPTVRVGVYEHNISGRPGALLAEGDAAAPASVGWFNVPLDTPVANVKIGDTVWLAANVSANINSCSPTTSLHNLSMYTNARSHAAGSMLDPFTQDGTYANPRGFRFTMELDIHEWAAPATNPVYILIGQSNAAGQADDAVLVEDFVGNNADVQVYALDSENWENLIHTGINKNNITPEDQSGFGGDRWGLEMPFGRMAADAFGDTVYIIKFAIGGTPLSPLVSMTNNWHPDTVGGYYDELIGYITDAMAELPEAGHIAGIIWYQGESDCDTAPEADDYEDNLGDLITALRSDLGGYYSGSLPFLLFRIYDQDVNATRAPQGPTVRAAQLAVAQADSDTYIASVDDLPIADTSTHLTTRG
jgi:hypothetical protein